MKFLLILLLLIPVTLIWANTAPEVSNVVAEQRSDGSMLVDIYYDVIDSDDDTLTVIMNVSNDDGLTWNLSCNLIEEGSDIGDGIVSGSGKHIIWNVGEEHPNVYGEDFRFKIIASDIPGGSIGMVYVPGGSFTMGDTHNGSEEDELPIHQIVLSSFYIGRHEVTQEEYDEIMGLNPAQNFGTGDDYPVYYVSWYDAIKYCNKRSMLEGLIPCYSVEDNTDPDTWEDFFDPSVDWNANGYRLPTEAEWEYAARGGTNLPDLLYSGSDNVDEVAWYDENNSVNGNKPVETKEPNGLGIYDMSGNVWEWCWDWYNTDYYTECNDQGIITDPQGAVSGTNRVKRGGCWGYSANYCRVSDRTSNSPEFIFNGIGFRVVRISL